MAEGYDDDADRRDYAGGMFSCLVSAYNDDHPKNKIMHSHDKTDNNLYGELIFEMVHGKNSNHKK